MLEKYIGFMLDVNAKDGTSKYIPIESEPAYKLPIGNNLARNIKDYRIKTGISQQRLADELGIERQTISKWENAKSEPDIVNLIRMSELFHTTVEKLVSGCVYIDWGLLKEQSMDKENADAENVIAKIPLDKVKLVVGDKELLWEMLKPYVNSDEEQLSIGAFKKMLVSSNRVEQMVVMVKNGENLADLMVLKVTELKESLDKRMKGLVFLLRCSEDYRMENIFRALVKTGDVLGYDIDTLMGSFIDEELHGVCEVKLMVCL